MTNGWRSLHNKTEHKKTTYLNDDDIIIATVFNSENGKKALEVLKKLTLDKPSLQVMHNDGINTTIAMAMREGENNLFRKILLIIKKVNDHVCK
jgi:hypothetical protein